MIYGFEVTVIADFALALSHIVISEAAMQCCSDLALCCICCDYSYSYCEGVVRTDNCSLGPYSPLFVGERHYTYSIASYFCGTNRARASERAMSINRAIGSNVEV